MKRDILTASVSKWVSERVSKWARFPLTHILTLSLTSVQAGKWARALLLLSLTHSLTHPLTRAAAPIQLHINTAVDTPASALKKTETNFTSLFQAVTALTNTITFYGATNSPVDFSTTNLQLAIDSSKGAGVRVPAGRYLIGATIDLPDNTRLIGDGMSSELVLTNVDLGLSAYGKTNIQIIGLKFSGKYSQAIAALFCTNVLVRECEFTDATQIPQSGWIAPVRSQSSFGVHVQSCRFYGNGSSTASFESSAEILIGGTADITRAVLIEDCVILGKNTHFSIATLDMQDGRVVNNFVNQGNNLGILNVGGYGILSLGTMGPTAQRNIFTGNTVTNCAGSGIYLSNNIGSKVFDNHVATVTIQQTNASATVGGIVLEASSFSDISANWVTNSPVAGLVSTGPHNSITDNVLGGTLSPTSLIGILLSGSDTTVDRNFIRGFVTGINNTGASNRVGILNLIHDNTVPLSDAGGAVVKTITAGSAPSVRDAPSYLLLYPSPTSITDFTDGLPGMDRTFFAANTNVTLVNSAGLLLNGGADLNLATGQILVLRRDAASAWHQVAGVGSVNFQTGGETNTASNLGTNGAAIQGLFSAKNLKDLQFRSLAAGTGITLSSNAATILITGTGGETNTSANLGTNGATVQGLANGKSGLIFQFRSLEAGSGVTLTSNANTVAIAASSSGETNTASNLGTNGASIQGLFAAKTLKDLQFRSLQAGSGILLTSNASTVTLSATATSVGGAYSTVKEEGVALTTRDTLNFSGAAITAVDNPGATRTDVTLSQSPSSASVVGTGRTITAGRGLVGGGDLTGDRTFAFSYADTLASNPAMNANETEFGFGGIIFEGTIADNNEGLLIPVNPTADRIWALPDASGTIPVSASAPLALSVLGNLTIALGDPVTAAHGGTGNDLSGSLSGGIPFFELATGKFVSSMSGAYTNAICYSQAAGILSLTRSNITGGPFLLMAEGSGGVPFMYEYVDKFVAANTNLSLDVSLGYAVRARINQVAGLQLTPNLSVVIGDGTSTTTRTNKFLYVPTFGGPPTGIPAVELAGTVPLGYDTVGSQLYFYNGACVKLNPAGWVAANTNATLTGNAAANSITSSNGLTVLDVTASSLVRTDSSKKLSPVTLGANVTFDGTTLAANNANLRANGTTNADLSGILTVNSEVITNNLTLAAQTPARFLGVSAGGVVVSSLSSARLSDTLTDETGSGAAVFGTAPVLDSPALIGTLTAAVLAITNALTLYAQTASRVLAVDSSKNVLSTFASSVLLASLTDETGTGLAVFATAPTLTTPTNSGVTTFTDRRRQTGVISPTQITSDKNDYNPTSFSTAAVVRINSDAARNITGLLAGIAGDEVLLFNSGSFNITLNSQNVSSDATNRFALVSDLILFPNGGMTLFYDGTSTRWRTRGGGNPTALTTASPGSGSAPWQLGTVITGVTVALTTTNYVEVLINGVVKKLALVQ